MKGKNIFLGIITALFVLILAAALLSYHYGFLDKYIYQMKNKLEETKITQAAPADINPGELNLDFIEKNYPDYLESSEKMLKDNEKMYEEIIDIINKYRYEDKKEGLETDNDLMIIAQTRAEEIAKSKVTSHTRPDGNYFSTIFNEYGITDGKVGENIAWGYSTAEEVCGQWQASKTHNENLLNAQWTRTGIGIAKYDNGYVFVQEFAQ